MVKLLSFWCTEIPKEIDRREVEDLKVGKGGLIFGSGAHDARPEVDDVRYAYVAPGSEVTVVVVDDTVGCAVHMNDWDDLFWVAVVEVVIAMAPATTPTALKTSGCWQASE